MLFALSTHWSKLLDAKWCMPLMIFDDNCLVWHSLYRGEGVGRMMIFQCGTWRVLVGLGIVIKCGTWRVLNIPTSLLSTQIRHLRWCYFEIYALIRVVGLVARFPTPPILPHLDLCNSRYDVILTAQKTSKATRYCTRFMTSKPFLS